MIINRLKWRTFVVWDCSAQQIHFSSVSINESLHHTWPMSERVQSIDNTPSHIPAVWWSLALQMRSSIAHTCCVREARSTQVESISCAMHLIRVLVQRRISAQHSAQHSCCLKASSSSKTILHRTLLLCARGKILHKRKWIHCTKYLLPQSVQLIKDTPPWQEGHHDPAAETTATLRKTRNLRSHYMTNIKVAFIRHDSEWLSSVETLTEKAIRGGLDRSLPSRGMWNYSCSFKSGMLWVYNRTAARFHTKNPSLWVKDRAK